MVVKHFILVGLLIVISACGVSENSTMEKHNKEPLSDSKNILGGILVSILFRLKTVKQAKSWNFIYAVRFKIILLNSAKVR